jgi:hypothetical protein
MAIPFLGQALKLAPQARNINTMNPQTIQDYLYLQWHNPGDILSVLLILGPDIVKLAICELAGRTIAPVAFSFGWVAYAISALLSTIGGEFPSHLMKVNHDHGG